MLSILRAAWRAVERLNSLREADRYHEFERAGGTEEVSVHRFSGTDRDRIRAFAKHSLDGGGFYSIIDGKVMAVTNAETGAPVARIPIGEGPDSGLIHHPGGGHTVTRVRTNLFRRPETILSIAP